MPNFESFKNGKQFLVIYIIVQLHCSKSVGVKDNQINFIFIYNEKKYSKSIIQSISFHDEYSIRNLISENRSGGKYLLERVENIITKGVKPPENILLGELYQCQTWFTLGVKVYKMDLKLCELVEQSWLQLMCCAVGLPHSRNFR